MNYLSDADYTELRVFNRETREIHEKETNKISTGFYFSDFRVFRG